MTGRKEKHKVVIVVCYKLPCNQGLLLRAVFIFLLVVIEVIFLPIPLGETQIWNHVAHGHSSQGFKYPEATAAQPHYRARITVLFQFSDLCL